MLNPPHLPAMYRGHTMPHIIREITYRLNDGNKYPFRITADSIAEYLECAPSTVMTVMHALSKSGLVRVTSKPPPPSIELTVLGHQWVDLGMPDLFALSAGPDAATLTEPRRLTPEDQ